MRPLETADEGDPIGVQSTIISLGDAGIFVLNSQLLLWKLGGIVTPIWNGNPGQSSANESVYPALLAAPQQDYQRLLQAANISIASSGSDQGFDMLTVQVFRSGVLILDSVHVQEYSETTAGPDPSEVRSRNAVLVAPSLSAHQFLAEHPAREALFRNYDREAVPEKWRGKVSFRRPSVSQSILKNR